ncbi:hypothetical protein V6O07_20230, partial [Arthrospira platensis SPKY2]
ENLQSQNTKTVSKTVHLDVRTIMINNGIDPFAEVGKTIEFHVHAENIYDFSQTWDGTRVGAGEWSKSIVFDTDPWTSLSVNRSKGENVTVTITKSNKYTSRVRSSLKVKRSGEPDSALKT